MCDKYLKVHGQIQTLYFHNVNSNSEIIDLKLTTNLLLLKTQCVLLCNSAKDYLLVSWMEMLET